MVKGGGSGSKTVSTVLDTLEPSRGDLLPVRAVALSGHERFDQGGPAEDGLARIHICILEGARFEPVAQKAADLLPLR